MSALQTRSSFGPGSIGTILTGVLSIAHAFAYRSGISLVAAALAFGVLYYAERRTASTE